MSNKLRPVVTEWYERRDNGEVFEVIAVDDADGVVDIQNLDGEVAEVNMRTWRELDIDRADSPEWDDRFSAYESDLEIINVSTPTDHWQQVPFRSMH